MSERAERCATCRFWDAREDEDWPGQRSGWCRRRAPMDSWPLTDECDWCGEWKRLKPDADA